MKSISISKDLHSWIMDHKNSKDTSAEKVLKNIIQENTAFKKKEAWARVLEGENP
jgi:succinate dehydrogenase flavin-adding protein (antitoxin of CptAB toxin-antitoxin module)